MTKEQNKIWVTASEVGQATFCPISVERSLAGARRNSTSKERLAAGAYRHDSVNREAERKTPCYVSTHVFGDKHDITEDLRVWREVYLMSSVSGRFVTIIYYKASPILIRYLGRFAAFNQLIGRLVRAIHSRVIE